ncbi:Uncharacterized conserved protein [Amphritea atlantica]|uniref:Uncharacterized conserved protein n=1 Tax=Amphritea atlantica TaxID=355243 RepID=A0A1H9KIL4_9GAMM|nr:VF530 family protein [Amphritea atlantica]SEQ98693.1 Uncharacterized conserved protein [Amphritea atlantica]
MTAGQKNNPLHGITLQQIVTDLEAEYGWQELGQRINIRCFQSDPSIKSSLKFLRKTPWAREKVEQLWIQLQTRKTIWTRPE